MLNKIWLLILQNAVSLWRVVWWDRNQFNKLMNYKFNKFSGKPECIFYAFTWFFIHSHQIYLNILHYNMHVLCWYRSMWDNWPKWRYYCCSENTAIFVKLCTARKKGLHKNRQFIIQWPIANAGLIPIPIQLLYYSRDSMESRTSTEIENVRE